VASGILEEVDGLFFRKRTGMNSKIRISACVLVLATSIAGAATLGGGGDARALDTTQKFDLAADAAAQAATYVATQAEGKLKGLKRVAITNMCLQFVNGKSATGQMSGGTITYTRSAEGGIPGGLDPARMQAVADEFLVQIEKDFTAAGIEVLPYEQLAANDLFQKFAAKYDSGIRVGTRQVSAGKGGDAAETVVYVSPKGRPFAPDCGTISPASTGTFVRMAYPLNAEFLTISAVIDMGTVRASGGLIRGAKAEVEYAQHLRAGDSQYQFVGKTGPGARVWLKQSIVPAQDPFATGAAGKTERSGSYDAGSGTTTTQSTTTQQVSFDEQLYYRNASEHLAAMHRMFMTRIAAK
jgi:hypothetical protein